MTGEKPYVLFVWDYDAAPDGDGYYLWKVEPFTEARWGIARADQCKEELCAVGTALVERAGKKLVHATGVTIQEDIDRTFARF